MDDEEREATGALRRGDIGGLEALVRLHQVRAVRASFAITGDSATAEDVVAEAFLTVYERIDQFDSRRPFAPWLYRIVINGSLKALRRTQRVLVSSTTLPAQAPPPSVIDTLVTTLFRACRASK